ncbi:uncharacterized protein AB9W97_009521 isoform 1-T1 [Spinachia spinachia]
MERLVRPLLSRNIFRKAKERKKEKKARKRRKHRWTLSKSTSCLINDIYPTDFNQNQRYILKRRSINSGLCENLQIARSLCAPCHPQTNGLVEKLNGTIQGALKKMISEERIHLLMANEDVSTHTNNLKEVYHKVEANIAEMQEKTRCPPVSRHGMHLPPRKK